VAWKIVFTLVTHHQITDQGDWARWPVVDVRLFQPDPRIKRRVQNIDHEIGENKQYAVEE